MVFPYYLFVVVVFLFSLPFQLLIALSVFLCSGTPVFFGQKRIGKDGKPFVLYKFRTMVRGSEKKNRALTSINEADGPVFKIFNDPRFTGIGKLLSHTGCDELPQLYNILRGEMAFIGPRPLPVGEAAKLKPWQRKREAVKPGIVSPWILEGYHHKSFDEWMKSDIRYMENKGFIYDCGVALRMVPYIGKLLGDELYGLVRPRV